LVFRKQSVELRNAQHGELVATIDEKNPAKSPRDLNQTRQARECLISMRKPFDVLAEGLLSEKLGATGFEPTTSRIRSKRSFLKYCTLVSDATALLGVVPSAPLRGSETRRQERRLAQGRPPSPVTAFQVDWWDEAPLVGASRRALLALGVEKTVVSSGSGSAHATSTTAYFLELNVRLLEQLASRARQPVFT
jgi:hypothetical protein